MKQSILVIFYVMLSWNCTEVIPVQSYSRVGYIVEKKKYDITYPHITVPFFTFKVRFEDSTETEIVVSTEQYNAHQPRDRVRYNVFTINGDRDTQRLEE